MHSIAILAVLGIFLLSSWDCKSPDSSEVSTEANLIVINASGIAVDIYLDGVYRLSIENDASATLEKIALGINQLEVRVIDSAVVIQLVEFNLDQGGDLEWTIQGPATLTVTNSYGETLQIFNRGAYLGDIADAESKTIGSVPFGPFLLEAKKLSDGTLVSSFSTVINEVKEYLWVISK